MCSIVRQIMITLNLILVGLCVCAISLGAYLLFNTKDGYLYIQKLLGLPEFINTSQDKQQDNTFWVVRAGAWFLIILGGFVGGVAFLGLYGAMKEWANLLLIYAFILIVMAIGKAIVIKTLTDTTQDLPKVLQDSMRPALFNYYVPIFSKQYTDNSHLTHKSFTLLINAIQVVKKCCFFHPTVSNFIPKKWKDSNPNSRGARIDIPLACCPVHRDFEKYLMQVDNWNKYPDFMQNRDCASSKSGMHSMSCFESLSDAIAGNMKIIYGLLAGLTLVEIALAVLSILFGIAPSSDFGGSTYG